MDFIENLANKASQVTMYDVKSYYNQAKNMVLNVPEMEAKVREATNEDPWGASSTLMQEIAQGTHNYQHFNEIMPTIYSRFMEKEAREWRQIYKALTLLEYLVKHGSERVVDDARAHISTIKMLRNFHYIDEKGKDQGINVRNRASEIAQMLSDVEKIRTERRKARANRSKYQGVEGGMFNTATGSRYGGFGSDSFGRGGGGGSAGGAGSSGYGGSSSGGFGGDEYRGGSSSGYGGRSGGFRETEGRQSYDEYEGADNFDDTPRRTGSARTNSTNPPSRSNSAQPPKPVPKEQPKKEVNLFDFDDEPAAPAVAPAAPAAAAPAVDAFGDDDFDDFQSAAAPAPAAASTSPAPAAAPAASANANLFALLESNKPQAAAPAPAFNMGGMASALPASTPSYASPPVASSALGGGMASGMGMGMGGKPAAASAGASASKPAAKGSAFDDLWTSSLGGPAKPAAEKKTIGQMEKEHATSGLWGASKPAQPQQPQQSQAQKQAAAASGFDDLLL